jgi:hypothetical protein
MLSTDLEIRLAALEAEVALLKRLLPTVSETPGGKKLSALLLTIQLTKRQCSLVNSTASL